MHYWKYKENVQNIFNFSPWKLMEWCFCTVDYPVGLAEAVPSLTILKKQCSILSGESTSLGDGQTGEADYFAAWLCVEKTISYQVYRLYTVNYPHQLLVPLTFSSFSLFT
jgi:hypothetical protein